MILRILALLVVARYGSAMSPFKQSLTVKHNAYIQDGVFTGGQAGSGSTLLGIRRVYSAKAKIERVIVDLGDKDAKPAGKNPGYFQAAMDSANNRITLDLAQLHLSKVSEPKLKELFKTSAYVASVEFTLDPEDKSGTIVLNLKAPSRLEVFQLLDSKKPARIVLDISPKTTLRSTH